VNFFGNFLSEPIRKLRNMILDLSPVAILLPFSCLRRVNGSWETTGSRDAEGTLVAKEDVEHFL
jgi:hypothetical protein